MNKIKLEEGMNVLDGVKWGSMHIFVHDQVVTEVTVFNAKKKSCITRKCKGGLSTQARYHLITLFLETDKGVQK